MNKKLMAKRLGVLCMAAAVTMIPVAGVMAAPEDIIDTTKTANLTIHKYDLTAATEKGFDQKTFTANGKKDAAAEEALKNYVIPGVEFTYVRVGSINTVSEGGKIEVRYDIPTALETALGLTNPNGNHQYTADQLNKAMATTLTDNTAGKNKLEQWIDQAGDKHAMKVTDDSGVTKATDLQLGLYLIVETKVPANVHTTVDPFFVSLPMTDAQGESWFYDVDVYPKNQTNIPTLDKLVRQHDDVDLQKPEYGDTCTASEGDKVDYIFVSHLPKITSEATYLKDYTFTDTMDKGLTYTKNDVAIYFYQSEEDAKANNTAKAVKTWEAGSNKFTVSYDGSNSDHNQMTVTPTAEGLKEIDPSLSQHYLVVSYGATVNSNETPVLGDTGNINNVTLKWKRTTEDRYDTLEDRAKVFTFGLNIKKNFENSEDKKGNPADVKFSLKNESDGHYVTATGSNGVYYVTDGNKGKTEAEGTVFSPAADGTLKINGLEANTYVLTELETTDGFSLLKEPLTIDIKSTEDTITPSQTTLYDLEAQANNQHKNLIDTAGKRASATVDKKDTNMSSFDGGTGKVSTDAYVDISVLNSPTFKLPMTGGMGTILFTLSGCAAALGGVVLVTKKNKKKEA